jgi:large subunit ribosomal protein L3
MEVAEEKTKEEHVEQATQAVEPTETSEAPALNKPVILGRKLGMLNHFKEDGTVVAATVIAADANVVTGVRTREKHGYAAIQLGFGKVDAKKLNKPLLGHLKALPPLKHLREIRLDDVAGFATGQTITVERFAPGDKVHVSGVSKGKGFQGPIHLHHFSRGPKSHGSDHLRRQGSVGSGTTPGRVLKGLRMARIQGNDKVTVRNLVVLRADAGRSLLIIGGAVPGARNGIVMVRKA